LLRQRGDLSNGEPDFALTQLALNDSIMVFACAPIGERLSAINVLGDATPVCQTLHHLAGGAVENTSVVN
jgi:ACR3 family arsenite efflux pump ArsB